MNFSKIVLAVDLDPTSLKTLGQVKKLGIDRNTEIHLVHVFELVLYNFELTPILPPSGEDYMLIEKTIEEKLEAVKRDLGLADHPKVSVKCLISEGARQEFLQYTEKVKPDLVVAASQEKSGMKGFFEGSFTSFLTKFSRSHLLILRPEH
jgi:nucleotide-binding universal stress UspA family protein